MRRSLFFLAAALSIWTSASAFAQGGGGGMGGGGAGGGTGGGTGTGGGGTSFTGGGGTSMSGGTSFTGSTSFTGGSGGTSFTGTTTGTTAGGGGGMRGTGGAGTSGFSPSTTNFANNTASNVLWPGRPGSTNLSNKTTGGWGQPTLSGTATAGRRAAGGTATANRAGARTGTNSNSGMGGSVIPITYAMEVKFAAPPIAAPKFQADLQDVVSRSSQLSTPGTVKVDVVGDTVVLRGLVADEDEKRLVEGMVRLEPGVHEVRNELAVIPPKK